MKNSSLKYIAGMLLILFGTTHCTFAQGTAFTYQGRLDRSNGPAIGTYDLTFALFNAASGGGQISFTLTNATVLSNGLFTVSLDFGPQFYGLDRWLEIGVRTNGGGTFALLSPRQKLTPTPYALYAPQAGTATTAFGVTADAVSGTGLQASSVTSPKIADGTITAVDVNSASFSTTFWKVDGNANTTPGMHFLGTADNLALEFKVNATRALRLEPNASGAPNVIGGSPVNAVGFGVVGATIGGGGALNFFGGAYTNRVEAYFSTVSGGRGNRIQVNANDAMIGGGYTNTIQNNASSATIGGGYLNTIQTDASAAIIGGGEANTIQSNAFDATIGGGNLNTIQTNAYFATIPGGQGNTATNYAFAAGNRAKANHTGAFVWADSQAADFASTIANQFNVRAGGGVRLITGGAGATLDGQPILAGNSFNTEIVANGGVRLNDANLWFRGGGDVNHGLGWYGSGKPFASIAPDGPVLFGFAGGALGTERFGTEKIALSWNDSGNVGIGRIPTANALEVAGDASKTTAGNWLANSDARIKRDIRTVTNALEKLAQVRLVNFRYTDEYRAAHPVIVDREYLNVVAQEFREVFPDAVQSSREKLPSGGDEILQVDSYPLTIYSAAAIQELNQKLTDQLKRRDAENAELKARLEKLERLMNEKNGGVK